MKTMLLLFPNVGHFVSLFQRPTWYTRRELSRFFIQQGQGCTHSGIRFHFVCLIFWYLSICIWCSSFWTLEFSKLSRFFICSLKCPPFVIMVMQFNASNNELSKQIANIEVIFKNFVKRQDRKQKRHENRNFTCLHISVCDVCKWNIQAVYPCCMSDYRLHKFFQLPSVMHWRVRTDG